MGSGAWEGTLGFLSESEFFHLGSRDKHELSKARGYIEGDGGGAG